MILTATRFMKWPYKKLQRKTIKMASAFTTY
jgi:hypothetical protein